MIFVGCDWSRTKHDLALLDQQGGTLLRWLCDCGEAWG